MKSWYMFLFLSLHLSIQAWAVIIPDSVAKQRFQRLADDIRLRTPELKEGDYEVRIWNKQSFQYGNAQMLYVLTKVEDQFNLSKYILKSGKKGFKSAKKLNPAKPVTDSLWLQLLEYDILILPDEKTIDNQLHPVPKSHSGHAAGTIEKDGSFTIYGYKTEHSVYITDGENYYFELFSANDYKIHRYDNPESYLCSKPNVVELQRVVSILNIIASYYPPVK